MGAIMVESGTVAPEDLERGLSQQWIDMLGSAELFQSLSAEQVRQVARVAEDTTIPKNTILCCTSADLKTMAENGDFSNDLYGFLAEQTIEVPTLRRRKKDLRLLVDYLIKHYSRQLSKSVTGVGQKAYSEIMAYDWPGNMDELEVVVRRAVNLANYEKLTSEDLFIGLAPKIDKFTFNLLRQDKVKRLFKNK